MKTRSEFDPRRDDSLRMVSVALIALLTGTLLGPSAAAAASSAWVRVKNWPVVQKVLVVNTSAAPVYTQPPAHQIVNIHGGAAILNSGSGAWTQFYTVPANKWLVITSMRAEGSGSSPITGVALASYTNIHYTFPIVPYQDTGTYNISAVVDGTEYVPPGTTLYVSLVRNTTGTGQWNIGVYADGYLTDRP